MSQEGDYYRGYLLVRLARIGTEWDITDKMMGMEDPDKHWEITYATPIYGAWDLLIEISFKKLENLDTVVTKLRADDDIRDFIEETTTLVSSKPNYIETREKYGKD